MKILPLLLLLLLPLVSAGQTPDFVERLANAIQKAEGLSSRYPYGIKSIAPPSTIKTRAELDAWARRICINTIRNNWKRWEKAGRPGEYIDFLADRYCPPSVDLVGNRNWKRNVKKILAEQTPTKGGESRMKK